MSSSTALTAKCEDELREKMATSSAAEEKKESKLPIELDQIRTPADIETAFIEEKRHPFVFHDMHPAALPRRAFTYAAGGLLSEAYKLAARANNIIEKLVMYEYIAYGLAFADKESDANEVVSKAFAIGGDKARLRLLKKMALGFVENNQIEKAVKLLELVPTKKEKLQILEKIVLGLALQNKLAVACDLINDQRVKLELSNEERFDLGLQIVFGCGIKNAAIGSLAPWFDAIDVPPLRRNLKTLNHAYGLALGGHSEAASKLVRETAEPLKFQLKCFILKGYAQAGLILEMNILISDILEDVKLYDAFPRSPERSLDYSAKELLSIAKLRKLEPYLSSIITGLIESYRIDNGSDFFNALFALCGLNTSIPLLEEELQKIKFQLILETAHCFVTRGCISELVSHFRSLAITRKEQSALASLIYSSLDETGIFIVLDSTMQLFFHIPRHFLELFGTQIKAQLRPEFKGDLIGKIDKVILPLHRTRELSCDMRFKLGKDKNGYGVMLWLKTKPGPASVMLPEKVINHVSGFLCELTDPEIDNLKANFHRFFNIPKKTVKMLKGRESSAPVNHEESLYSFIF